MIVDSETYKTFKKFKTFTFLKKPKNLFIWSACVCDAHRALYGSRKEYSMKILDTLVSKIPPNSLKNMENHRMKKMRDKLR